MAVARHRAFGLRIESHLPLPGMPPADIDGEADVSVSLGDVEALCNGGAMSVLWEGVLGDGCSFRIEAGTRGDHLMTYGARAAFHLSADRRTLTCEPAAPESAAWQRVLLDSVLAATSLLHGFQLLHAGAVETPRGVCAIAAGTGGGKSSAIAELARRGMPLFADDLLALEPADGDVMCHPAPPVMNVPLGHPAIAELGESIATFHGERETWIAVRGAATEPRRLAAIYLLDRRPAVETLVEPLPPNVLQLLPYSLSLHPTVARSRRHFEALAGVAARVPACRLQADVSTGSSEIADLIEDSVMSPRRAMESVA